MKKAVVITCAGAGSRFRKEGCDIWKPLIEVNGRRMINRLKEKFPSDLKLIVITSRRVCTEADEKDIRDAGFHIIFIPDHKDGPAMSLHLAAENLKTYDSIFVTYVDHFWDWDFPTLPFNDHQNIVFTHSCNHPHLRGGVLAAHALEADDKIVDIREKAIFTEKEQNGFKHLLSIGVFYFSDVAAFLDYNKKLIVSENRVADEFFPTQTIGLMLSEGFEFINVQIKAYIHYGTPEALNDFRDWTQRILQAKPLKWHLNAKPNFITLMAGKGSRMRNHSRTPKPLIHVQGAKMYVLIEKMFGCDHSNRVVSKSVLSSMADKDVENQIEIPDTDSQHQTIQELLASNSLKKSELGYLILSCDAYGSFDTELFAKMIRDSSIDGIAFGFKHSMWQSKNLEQSSHINSSNNICSNIYVKEYVPDCFGLAGFFWIRDLENLNVLCRNQKRELLLDDVFDTLNQNKPGSIGFIECHSYTHLGSEIELDEFNYWDQNISCLY